MTYKNPIPRLGGKKFILHIPFDFDEFVEIHEAEESIKRYITENGIPKGSLTDITPYNEYRKG